MSNKPTKAEILANIAWIYNGNHYENREYIGVAVDGYFVTCNMLGEVIEPIDYHNIVIPYHDEKEAFYKMLEKSPKKYLGKYFADYHHKHIVSGYSTMYHRTVFRGTYYQERLLLKILNMGFEPYGIYGEECRMDDRNIRWNPPEMRYVGMMKHCKTGLFIGVAIPGYMLLDNLYEKYYFHLTPKPLGFIGSEGSFGFQAALDVNGIDYSPDVLLPPVSKTKVIDEAKPLPKPKKQIDDNQPDLFGEVA